MPIPYAERKKRRQALRQQFPPELREHLALRHVEAVAKLPTEAQRTLAEALSAGLRRIPDAIALLREQPEASADEVLQAGGNGRQEGSRSSTSRADPSPSPVSPDPKARAELAELLGTCFPGMPGMTCQALAADELLSGVLNLVGAWRTCLGSKSIQSELVFVALCGLVLRFIDELNRLMDSRSHYRGALAQSGLDWPFGEQPATLVPEESKPGSTQNP